MNGLLIVDKPAGITSHGVVARCRKALNERKIGHAGTLDPDATGVLVLGVGRATRLMQFLESDEKSYVATFALGAETSTQDASGEIIASHDASGITEQDGVAAMKHLEGEIDQVPPMVSAVKIGGEALYKKARRGEEIDRPARRITIHELVLESFSPPTIRVRCSKGTYIRTLVHDLGRSLGVGAHVVTLRRTASGAFTEHDAIALDAVGEDSLRSLEEAVSAYPRRDTTFAEALMLCQGKRIPEAAIDGTYGVFFDGRLIAMARDERGECKTLCVLVDAAAISASVADVS
ncbi:MAG: tRNA pseudouridine(55) synthase TruB [Actinomycetota bacterium]